MIALKGSVPYSVAHLEDMLLSRGLGWSMTTPLGSRRTCGTRARARATTTIVGKSTATTTLRTTGAGNNVGTGKRQINIWLMMFQAKLMSEHMAIKIFQ